MINKLLGNKSLDSILSSFTRTMDDLKTYADKHHAHTEKKDAEVKKLNAEIADHIAEKVTALDIHSNLAKLLMKGN